MVDCNCDISPGEKWPALWSHTPAREDLEKAYEEAYAKREPAEPTLFNP